MVYPVGGGRFVASFLKRLRRTEVSNTVIGITTNQRTIHRCVEMLMESPTEIRAVLRERLKASLQTRPPVPANPACVVSVRFSPVEPPLSLNLFCYEKATRSVSLQLRLLLHGVLLIAHLPGCTPLRLLSLILPTRVSFDGRNGPARTPHRAQSDG